MTTTILKTTRLVLILSSAPVCSQAALVATYIDGTDVGDTNIPASFVADNLSASTIDNTLDVNDPVRASFGNVTWGGGGTDFRFAANADNDARVKSTSTPPTGSYIGFTLTADAEFQLQLSSMTFDWGIGSNADPDTTDFGYQVFARVDGGTWSEVGSDEIPSTNYAANTFTDLGQANIDMSGLGTTVEGGNAEVRLYSYTSIQGGAGSNVATVYSQIDFNGEVIPEPTSAVLTVMAGLTLLTLRRR